MLKHLLLLFLVFLSISAQSQEWQWVKGTGGLNYSDSKRIASDGAGNSYVVGNFANSITFGTTTLTGGPNGNAVIAKHSNEGQLIWAKQISGTSVVEATDIAADADGNVYVTGNFKGTVSVGSYTLSSIDDRAAFIVKLDTDGTVVWADQGKSADGDVKGENITVDANGNVYVTGNFFKSATFGSSTLTATKDEQVFILKYTASGEVTWAKVAGGLGSCTIKSIAADKNGNLYLTGQFWQTAVFGTTVLYKNDAIITPGEIFIAKYDAAGNAVWAKQAGGAGSDVGAAIAVDGSGNCYITGFFQGSATFDYYTISGGPGRNLFLAEYTASGSLYMLRKYSGTGDAVGTGLGLDAAGNIYTAGYYEGSIEIGNATLISYGDADIFFTKYDALGNVTGAMRAGGTGTDLAKDIEVSPTGQIYFAGNLSAPATFGSETLPAGMFFGKINTISYNQEPAPTITLGALSTNTLCIGETIEVPFTTTGRFGDDNVFTVQLSGSTGSFSYPQEIGSGAVSPIQVLVPSYATVGSGYRIRIVASSPKVQSAANEHNLIVSKPPVVTVGAASTIVPAGTSTTLYASGADTYEWYPATGLSNAHVANPVVTPSSTTTYTVTGSKGGCSSTAKVTVRVEPLPAAGSAFEWNSIKYGGATSNSEAMATVTDAAGNVYVAGHFSDKITFGATTLTVPGYVGHDQIFIVKYDVNGEVLWAKEVGGKNNDALRDMTLDKLGNLYITGWFDPAITLGDKTFEGEAGFDHFVAKLDPNGNYIWANQVNGPENDVMAIAAGPNGEAYIAGTFGGTATFNNVSLVSSSLKDFFIVKYNEIGDVVWAEPIKGTSVKGYRPIDIATDSEGSIYATGCFNKGTLVFGPTMLLSSIEFTNSFFAKYSSAGQLKLVKLIGQNEYNYSHTTSSFIAIDKSDKIYLAGAANSRTRFSNFNFGDSGVTDNFLAQFDKEGKMNWVVDAGKGSISGLATNTESFVYITGEFNNRIAFGTKQFAIEDNAYAAFVTKYDALGNVLWAEQATAKRDWDISSNGITVDNNQNIYVVGKFDRSGFHDPVTFGCHTIQNEISGPGHYYIAKLSPIEGPVPAIVTGKLTDETLCAGSTIEVPFTATGNSAGCASYTVLLSDAKGSFAYAKIIGSGVGEGGSISASIPANTVAGNGYRVKVIGNAPAVTGTDNNTDISITALPVVSIVASNASPCPGATGITYTAYSTDQISAYSWTAPEGWTITEGQGTNKITVTAGTTAGNVTVAVSGACGPEVIKSLAVTPANIFAPTVWTASKTICSSTNTVFTASGAPYGATYRWYASATDTEPIWEDNPSGSESRFYTPVVSTTTNYYVSIRFSNGCEGERVKLTLNVSSIPDKPAAITASVNKPCVGSSVIYAVEAAQNVTGYTWSVPAGWAITSGQGTANITVIVGSAPGQVSVVAFNNCGPSTAQIVTVETGEPAAPTATAEARCSAGNVTISASGAPADASYRWYISASGGSPIATGPTYITPYLNTTTTYYVTAVTATGCESPRTAVTASILPNTTVDAGPDRTICVAGNSFFLSNYSPEGGTWSGTGVTATGEFSPSIAGVGTHTLTYTMPANSCFASATRTITVTPEPILVLKSFGEVCSTVRDFDLLAGQNIVGGFFSGPGVDSLIFDATVAGVGTHIITYTYNFDGGCTVSTSQTITVTTCTGLPESKQAANLILYPNPTQGEVQLELPLPKATAVALRLFDAKGRKLYEQNIAKVHGELKQALNLKSKPKGIYLLQLILDDGVIIRRIVKD